MQLLVVGYTEGHKEALRFVKLTMQQQANKKQVLAWVGSTAAHTLKTSKSSRGSSSV